MNDEAGEFPDLIAKLRSFLPGDPKIEEIVERLRARYVTSDRDDTLLTNLERLHRNACARRDPKLPYSPDNRRDGIGFVVVSKSGAGKSTALMRAFRKYPAFGNGFCVTGSGCPILSIEAPSPCTLKQLALAILDALGYHAERDLKENVAWKRARRLLKLHGIAFLHIDEAANVLHQKSEHEIRKIADTLRALMLSREWPVQIILSGVPEIEPLLDIDRQLRRRLRYVRFEDLSATKDAEQIENAMLDYAKAAELEVKLGPDDMLVGRLCHAAVYQFGLAMEIVVDAIERCLADRHPALTIEDFANAYANRNLQPTELNPFLVHAWDTLDCGAIRKRPPPATGDAGATVKRRKPRK